MTRDAFEQRFRRDPDPWRYLTSGYEHDKYAATLEACGRGPFVSALELGAANGVFTELLADRCQRLTTIDFAPSAVAHARLRLRHHPQVDIVQGTIPEDLPAGPFDLVVASEVLYYLQPDALTATLAALRHVTRPGARLVAVHWRPTGPDRWLDATGVHRTLGTQAWLAPIASGHTDDYLLDAWERR